MKWLTLIKKQIIVFSAVLVLVLITANTLIVYYNNWVLSETNKVRLESERATFLVGQVWNQVVRNVDVAMRGFALTKSEGLLGPLKDGIRDKTTIFKELREITTRQGFTRHAVIDSMAMGVDQFIEATVKMVELARIDSMKQFQQALSQDPGRFAWVIYDKNAKVINAFEDKLNASAASDYETANRNKLIFQTLLFIVSVPTLLFMISRIRRDKRSRQELFQKLEENNRNYLFNPGGEVENVQENEVIENSIRNFKSATQFISHIANGNMEVQWEGITPQNEGLNKDNLAGELLLMRDKMKMIKKEDEIRNWTSEGLAKFTDVLRANQESIEALCFDVLVYAVKYLKAQQGGIFVVKEDDDGSTYLDLAACYAFNRKKYINKRIDLGQGLVGQTFLEGQSVLLTEIPQGYTEITSGLGESTPGCLLLIPMKYNEKTEAIIEIASFKRFETHEIEFVEKIGESIASTLSTVKNTEKMKFLVDQFKVQTEQMKAQEEELRQNMEEMQATQEALRRQEMERQHG